ncbi:neurotrypsin-like [Mya arenaria]|uniref:neurotrypsin-like n=1 Tax=Mya arenaria TaxID=6604 RepID=UPI0022DF2B66|nr:neurotrypsin-like [Mya arenaria]
MDVMGSSKGIKVLPVDLSPSIVYVEKDGIKGFIYPEDWDDNDARVMCKQLGYKSGVALGPWDLGHPLYPYLISNVQCNGTEEHIGNCKFNETSPLFNLYRRNRIAARVHCINETVRLQPNVTFGAIQVWDRDNYRLVCAEGFDDLAAQAVCRSLGFTYGKSICCSAFGRMEYSIVYSNINCTGIESSILECDYVKYFANCTSEHYASVACSNSPENEEFELKIHQSGKVTTRHFDNSGFICANGFDDTEATVICKEMGYKGGSAYFHSRHTKYSTVPLLGVPWLANIACEGTEKYLGECGKINWGSVGTCDENRLPAVYCYNKTGFSFALVNGTGNDNGLVVFTVDDKEGAICLRDSVTEERQKLAAIVCKQLGYGNGGLLLNGTDAENEFTARKLFPGKSDMFITKIKCKGNESSLAECTFRILEGRYDFPEDWISITLDGCESSSCYRTRSYNRGYAFLNELSCWAGKRRLVVKCFL